MNQRCVLNIRGDSPEFNRTCPDYIGDITNSDKHMIGARNGPSLYPHSAWPLLNHSHNWLLESTLDKGMIQG